LERARLDGPQYDHHAHTGAIDHDGLQPGPPALSIPAIRVLGARYNRGMGLTLKQIGTNTSHGDFIVRNLGRFASLLT
jgi:hypothetical protein